MLTAQHAPGLAAVDRVHNEITLSDKIIEDLNSQMHPALINEITTLNR